MRLATVPSGTIDLVFDGHEVLLQFNCSCTDAMPYCHAMCCRLRPTHNVKLTEAEAARLKSYRHGTLPILEHRDGHCTYLEGNACSIYADRPNGCATWHCSPGGVGEGITMRDGGWALSPYDGNLAGRA